MNNLVEQRQGRPMVMDEIPRTYYPGRGFLTDQEAYPENPLYRTPRYSGGDPNLGNTAGMFKLPYYGGPMNPTQMPYYPGQDYGGVELLAGGFRPASYGAIRGGQTPYRFGPYLPYRGEERKEEETPFIPIPLQQAQGLPMGFQNKYVS